MPHLHLELARNHMATTFRFLVSCPSEARRHAESVLNEAHLHVARLEDELSEYRSGSSVWVLNHASVDQPVRFTEDALSALVLSLRIREETGSAFDPFAKGSAYSKERLHVDTESRTVTRLDPGLHLGFGAIGKGYALDRVRSILEREGFTDYLMTAGGSSSVISGYATLQGKPWDWSWSWKYDVDGDALGIPFAHATGQPVALGVSGTHEQGNHIIDPRSNEPATGLSSALVACQSAAWADAISTALFVGGLEAVDRVPRLAAAVVDGDDSVQWDMGFARLWGEPVLHG